jgi:hypothetical protein
MAKVDPVLEAVGRTSLNLHPQASREKGGFNRQSHELREDEFKEKV